MNRVAKILGAALIFGGVVWAFAAFGDLAAGFPLLLRFGVRHGQEVWEAGEWIEAGGTVRGVTSVEFGGRLRVCLTAVGHGAWNTEAFITDERQRELAERSKGASVQALVRSNDRKVVEILSVAGEAW